MLGKLATDEVTRKAEFSKRRHPFDEKGVPPLLVSDFEAQGWVFHKKLKQTIKLRKAKSHDEVLENQFWSTLYQIGYTELNVGRDFKIEIIDNDGKIIKKQVDVFAKDDETVVVAECKSSDVQKKKALTKDIGEFEANKKRIADAVRKHYGSGFKPKIIWCLVTHNIIWSKEDLQRAEAANIHVIRERERRYFAEIGRVLGKVARYQFHGEFLALTKMPALAGGIVPAIQSKLGGRKVFTFSALPSDLLRISFVNHRDLRDPSGIPSYQRLLKIKRITAIAKFIEQGGFFPNAIVANFKTKVRFDQKSAGPEDSIKFGDLHLPEKYKTCWIIDGQHRLYGYALVDDIRAKSPISVIAFDGLPEEEAADLFRTINKEQKTVSPKLLAELEGELKWDSPIKKEQLGAIIARGIDYLRNQLGTPFYDRIETPGIEGGTDRLLSLVALKQAILQSHLIGREAGKDKHFIPGPFSAKTNEDTLHRMCDGLQHYFTLVRDANIERWERGAKGFTCNNFGVPGHIRLLGALIKFMEQETKQDPHQLEPAEIVDALSPYMEPVIRFARESNDSVFEQQFKVRLGSGGSSQYFYNLCRLISKDHPSFRPEGLDVFVQSVSEEATTIANGKVTKIVKGVHRCVVDTLKKQYGDKYIDQGVPIPDIVLSATKKRLSCPADKQQSVDVYFDFIELKSIIEHKQNWPHFQSTLSVKLADDREGLAKYVSWFNKLNEIRRIPAHPFERSYSEDDIKVVDHVHAELEKRGVL